MVSMILSLGQELAPSEGEFSGEPLERSSHGVGGVPGISDERLCWLDEGRHGSVQTSRTKSTSDAPAASMTAIAIRPPAKLCVASLIAPSRYGPTKPPVFP